MTHIHQEQRYLISIMLSQNKSQKEISLAIGRDKSVTSREISRNCDKRDGSYNYPQAQEKCDKRSSEKYKKIYLTEDVKSYVVNRLESKLSPEQISGEAKLKGITCVSHETIYNHVWLDKKRGGKLHKHLRNKGRRYRKRGAKKDTRGIILNRVDIDQRPAIVEKKKRFGDFEIDTVIGKNHKGALVTMNDRASGVLKIRKVKKKESSQVTRAAISALSEFKDKIHTITSDNGKEFAGHSDISEKLKINFYFAKPYHSYERGANENANRLIRQYFPKKTDFSTITNTQVKWVENELNNRPRKRFNYLTPIEIFEKLNKVAFITRI